MRYPPPLEHSLKSRLRAGFTLVEIAIVLVIIGLIVGGILVGADLIGVARLRSQGAQIAEIKTGALAFKLKYEVLPGDISPSRKTQYGIPAVGYGGLADTSRLENNYIDQPTTNQANENFWFFKDLSSAGFLATCTGCDPASYNFTPSTFDGIFTRAKIGSGSLQAYGGAPPSNQFGGNTYNYYDRNYIEICKTVSVTSGQPLTPEQAFQIDSKFDDGNPFLGQIVATGNCHQVVSGDWWDSHPPSQGVGGTGVCVSTSTTPNSYNVSKKGGLCGVRFDGGF
jgi:prepilin-type N-terminal cleavage/methylation domain-containing protein